MTRSAPMGPPPIRCHSARWRPQGHVVLAVLLAVALGVSLAANLLLYPQARRQARLVAVSWGDSPAAPALYGAYVWLDGQGPPWQVKLAIAIDRPSVWLAYEHDPRVLGTVASPARHRLTRPPRPASPAADPP